MNDMWTFPGKETKQKHTQKCGKKKSQQSCIKKRGSSKTEWLADELFPGKTDKIYDFGNKEKHDFVIWMKERSTNLSREIKKYNSFGYTDLNSMRSK